MATLIRVLGDFDLAEEAVQEAFITALETWPTRGVPDNPGAWITTTARNRAIDRLRRKRVLAEKAELLGRQALIEEELAAIDPDAALDGADAMNPIVDDRLRLIFTCCHPALAMDARVALTLRTLGGLSTPEIARAFLVPEATLAQRLVRAKRKIRDAGIP
ncbi:MAG: polymerase sigma-70 factor, subfamily, partial [Chloroflexota bacterium]|nr:polymerase sigma-70 factor, subfamily [Chloroflexota bacterium]